MYKIYVAATVMAVFLWSTSFISTKIAYTTFPPITLGAARFILASGVIGLVLCVKREFILPRRKDMLYLFLSGSLGITVYFVVENIGLDLTTASNAALIVASYPAMTVLFEWRTFKIRPGILKVIGLILAVIGVCIVSGNNAESGGDYQLIGNVLLVIAGVIWLLYNLVTQKVVDKYPITTVSFYQTIYGTALFIPLAFVEMKHWQTPTTLSLLMLLHLGIFCSVIAFLLYNFGLRKLSSSAAMSLLNLVPVFGVVLSILVLRETITSLQLFGGAIVVAGVMLSVGREPARQIHVEEPF